jgi:hypothetical protein
MRKKTTSSEDQLRSQYGFRTIRVAPRSEKAELPANVSPEGKAVMGEVRVKVKLTNAGDQILVRRALLTADQIRSYEADAVADTGAVRSVLPLHVVQLLGLAIVGKARATYANDAAEDVDVSEVVGIRLLGRRTTEETLVLGSEVLIGQTVLASLDKVIGDSYMVAFRTAVKALDFAVAFQKNTGDRRVNIRAGWNCKNHR